MYGSYTSYIEYYGSDGLQENAFAGLGKKADRLMDSYTTTVDGVRKLKEYYPTDEASAEAVQMCHAEIVNILWQINEAEKAAQSARGYVETENGLRGKAISSVSAGNESISYSASGSESASTAIDKAVVDKAEQHKLILDVIRTYLSGISDRNGVNLMYGGRYPCLKTQ